MMRTPTLMQYLLDKMSLRTTLVRFANPLLSALVLGQKKIYLAVPENNVSVILTVF